MNATILIDPVTADGAIVVASPANISKPYLNSPSEHLTHLREPSFAHKLPLHHHHQLFVTFTMHLLISTSNCPLKPPPPASSSSSHHPLPLVTPFLVTLHSFSQAFHRAPRQQYLLHASRRPLPTSTAYTATHLTLTPTILLPKVS